MSTMTEPRATATTQRWVLDPTRSTVEFSVPTYWGRKIVDGRFTEFDGDYTIREDGRALELTIDADSLDTGNRLRDKHLRGADFFGAEEHPHVRFTAENMVDVKPGLLQVSGELEAAGKSIPVELEASVHDLGDELELEATTTVDQRRLGMTHSPLGMLGVGAALHVRARLVEAPA